MMTVQPWALAPRPHTDHSFKRWCTPQKVQRVHAHAWQPNAEQETAQRWNKLTGK
jgi:hypothetical protein